MAILDYVDCEKHGNKVGKIVCHGCHEQLQTENERLKELLRESVSFIKKERLHCTSPEIIADGVLLIAYIEKALEE